MFDDGPLLVRAQDYAHSKRIVIVGTQKLGHGSDGAVWRTTRPSAVKVFRGDGAFHVELECYRRLAEAGVNRIGRFKAPVLMDFDQQLLVIEMEIVTPPYLLDFGKVYLDGPPTDVYDERQMAAAIAEWRDRFGRHWPEVAFVLEFLKKFGIWYFDPRPSNIDLRLDDEADDEWLADEPPPPGDDP